MVSPHQEDDELPHWDGSSMHIGTPATAMLADGETRAARGIYLWDPDDPLTVSLHTQVAIQSSPVLAENFPAVPGEGSVLCWVCEETIEWGEHGVVLFADDAPTKQGLHCMSCAMDHDAMEIEEALWVMGLESIEGVAQADPLDPAPAGAPIRIWRASADDVTFAFTQGTNTVFITAPLDPIEKLLEAIKQFSIRAPFEDNYLASGLAALEKLANGKGQ